MRFRLDTSFTRCHCVRHVVVVVVVATAAAKTACSALVPALVLVTCTVS